MDVTSYPRTARLVNRFKVGADPEFIFVDGDGRYTFAEKLGLSTMHAFGCDMAGRQAEIRAYPSRFALETVASIVDSMRWLALTHSASLGLHWIAIAHFGKDGVGGHIHFGRRRPNRDQDIKVLDSVTNTLTALNILDQKNSHRRVSLTNYGKCGDIRLQAHGYEYRTLPTQLSSPWLTYFVLTLSKLAVYQGEKVPYNSSSILNLLEKYQDMDDDAAIALKALKLMGQPVDFQTDFKERWGVDIVASGKNYVDRSGFFFPSIIKPEESTCHELFMHLTQGHLLARRLPLPTWEPYAMPKNFYKPVVQQHSLGHLPDVAMNLISRGTKLALNCGDDFLIYTTIPLPEKEIKKALNPFVGRFIIKQMPAQASQLIEVIVPAKFKNSGAQCKMLHEVLSNTDLFPVCSAKKYKSIDWSKWDNNHAIPQKPSYAIGRVIGKAKGAEPDKVQTIVNKASVLEAQIQMNYAMQIKQQAYVDPFWVAGQIPPGIGNKPVRRKRVVGGMGRIDIND